MVASAPILLATKLYIPSPPPKVVVRTRLIEQLDEGLSAARKLTLISASAGFGKTCGGRDQANLCNPPFIAFPLGGKADLSGLRVSGKEIPDCLSRREILFTGTCGAGPAVIEAVNRNQFNS